MSCMSRCKPSGGVSCPGRRCCHRGRRTGCTSCNPHMSPAPIHLCSGNTAHQRLVHSHKHHKCGRFHPFRPRFEVMGAPSGLAKSTCVRFLHCFTTPTAAHTSACAQRQCTSSVSRGQRGLVMLHVARSNAGAPYLAVELSVAALRECGARRSLGVLPFHVKALRNAIPPPHVPHNGRGMSHHRRFALTHLTEALGGRTGAAA